MTYARDAFDNIPRLPSWVTSGRAEAPEDVAFLSGAVLSYLHLVLGREDVPQSLLRERLALRAAEACVTYQGRPERAGELRDAVQFLQPGDQPGPAGEIYLSWRRVVERPVSVKALHRALPNVDPNQIAIWLDAGQGAPVARAASVLEVVLENRPRDQTAALLLTEAALAEAVGGAHVVPPLGLGVKSGGWRKHGAATRVTADLTRRAAHLKAAAPRLRAKGAEQAVALFLIRDSVAPTALTSLRSDRAARRFCDRLVALGAVHELTGRDTFRL